MIESIEETKKEVAWDIEFRELAYNKLKEKFIDPLEYDKFTVKAIKKDAFTSTFRVKKMSMGLTKMIQEFKELIEKEYDK